MAHVTTTELVISPESGRPRRYPLIAVSEVRESGLPGGQSVVAITLRGRSEGPGLTFADPETATAFTNAVLRATD